MTNSTDESHTTLIERSVTGEHRPQTMTSATVSDILNFLDGRQTHCRELLELARRQGELIDAGDLGRLVEILGQKQRILGRLDAAKKQYPAVHRQWSSVKAQIDPQLRRHVEKRLQETERLLAELLREEQRCTDRLMQRRDDTRRQLLAITQGTQVHDAYRESLAPATHRHLNIDR